MTKGIAPCWISCPQTAMQPTTFAQILSFAFGTLKHKQDQGWMKVWKTRLEKQKTRAQGAATRHQQSQEPRQNKNWKNTNQTNRVQNPVLKARKKSWPNPRILFNQKFEALFQKAKSHYNKDCSLFAMRRGTKFHREGGIGLQETANSEAPLGNWIVV